MAVRIKEAELMALRTCAETSFPDEACALLTGETLADGTWIKDIHPSDNVAANPRRQFEVDPRLILKLQREIRDCGDHIVGVFHSHPTGRVYPSETDLARAWQKDFLWLIAAVVNGQVTEFGAFYPSNDGGFVEIDLHVR